MDGIGAPPSTSATNARVAVAFTSEAVSMTPRWPNRSASCPTSGPPAAAPAARKPAAVPPAPIESNVDETSTTVPIWVIEMGSRARKASGRKARPVSAGSARYWAIMSRSGDARTCW